MVEISLIGIYSIPLTGEVLGATPEDIDRMNSKRIRTVDFKSVVQKAVLVEFSVSNYTDDSQSPEFPWEEIEQVDVPQSELSIADCLYLDADGIAPLGKYGEQLPASTSDFRLLRFLMDFSINAQIKTPFGSLDVEPPTTLPTRLNGLFTLPFIWWDP